jgi:hypothetical protein
LFSISFVLPVAFRSGYYTRKPDPMFKTNGAQQAAIHRWKVRRLDRMLPATP